MVASWEFSHQYEVLRLLHIARQIANGFYKLNGFIVLPEPVAYPNGRIVPFPNLPYLKIPRFWDRVSKIDLANLPSSVITIDPDLITQTSQLLDPASRSIPDYASQQKCWQKYESEILDCIYSLIPTKKKFISSITIWPTSIGTSASFNICPPGPKGDVHIWLRQDKGISTIVESLLTSITRNDIYENLGGIWQESELVVDWLLSYSPLNSILKKADKDWESSLTIKNTRVKQDGHLIQKSNTFLEKMGVPSVNPTQINHINFSSRDKQIMDLLINSSPNPVTTDQLANIIFKNNPDEYSLFAISKTIQRLRDKLEQNGISGSFIQTKRGEGYLLSR